MIEALLILLVPPVPPPLEQATAECVRPTYASDMFVCGDVELKGIDALLAAERQMTIPISFSPTAIWEDDTSWFRRRSACAFVSTQRSCLTSAYAERRAVLASARAFDGTGDWTCSRPKGGPSFLGKIDSTGVLTVGSPTGIEGIATSGLGNEGGWKGYATYTVAKNRLTARKDKTTVFRCSPAKPLPR
jgi:uncharacterized protein